MIKFEKIKPLDCGDFALHLKRRGIHYSADLSGGGYAITGAPPEPFRERTRRWISRNSDRLFSQKTSAMVKALYFGNPSHIDGGTVQDFKRAGVLHVLAASGDHVGIIASIVFALLGAFRSGKKTVLAATVVILHFYLYLTDLPVSLMRAGIMYTVFSAQTIFDLDRNALNALFLSAAAITAAFPYEIFSLGFQLSFSATLGILLFHREYMKSFGWAPSKISAGISVSLSAQAAVIPILALRTGELNLAGTLSNLVVVPLVSLVLVTSMISNAVSIASGFAGGVFAAATDILNDASLRAVGLFAGLNGHFYIDGAAFLLMAPLALCLAPLLTRGPSRRAASAAVVAGIAACWLLMEYGQAARPEKKMEFLNSGKTLVAIEGRRAFVIGPIPGPIAGEETAGHLNRSGVASTRAYITATDDDSISGYVALIKTARVDYCALSSGFRLNGRTKRLFTALEKNGIKLDITAFGYANTPHGANGSGKERLIREYGKIRSRSSGKNPESMISIP
ncbi:MAG: ComEC/Rec2 family competence protein [Spirochaetes bacterium]|nr:ComEC/Rec2 family competence protein [Spirochaetota bacterium]